MSNTTAASKRSNLPATTSSTAAASATPNRSPSRQGPAPSSTSTTPARTGSIRSKAGPPPSAKAAAKRNSVVNASMNPEDEEARAETIALIDDLKEQLRKTETASEEYQKQLQVAQARLDEALTEQTKLEETANQHAETIASLEIQLRDLARKRSDLEAEREATETSRTQEREAASARQAELSDIIQRLKDTLAQRDSAKVAEGDNDAPLSTGMRGRSSANPDSGNLNPPSLERRDSSQHNAQLLLQKDRVIEELRLELAEAHVKVMEVDRAGGGRLQELEKQLLEVRMTNAKLMEDNESYQFLLQERTLNGEFVTKFRASTPSDPPDADGAGTLADELETADVNAELEDAKERMKTEKELSVLRDQNRAMQLYIDKIISKILASDHYEAIFNGNPDGAAGNNRNLQDPQGLADGEAGKENLGSSLLQRAGSIFGNRARPSRPSAGRAVSGATDASSTIQEFHEPLPNEDPNTAPSVPLRSRHRRGGSDQDRSAAPLTRFTTRTPSSTSNPNRRPSTPNESSSRKASFSTSTPPRDGIILEYNDTEDTSTTATRTASDAGLTDNTEVTSTSGPSSPPRSVGGASSADPGSRPSGGAAVFSGSSKQMRPLRLVQEKAEAERKKQNRGSWVGWFNNKAANFNPLAGYSETSAAPAQQLTVPGHTDKALPHPSESERPGSSGGG